MSGACLTCVYKDNEMSCALNVKDCALVSSITKENHIAGVIQNQETVANVQ